MYVYIYIIYIIYIYVYIYIYYIYVYIIYMYIRYRHLNHLEGGPDREVPEVVTLCLNERDSVCLNGRAGQGKPSRR